MTSHPAVAAAQRVADELLAPGAASVDAGTVRRADLDALGSAGLLGIAERVPAATFRAVQEVLAGADASTWFVSVQHHYPLRLLADRDLSPALDEARTDLRAGRRLAGVAFSHLRRWPARPVQVDRVDGGWRFDGQVPWYTGWGLNDVLALGGATAGGDVVFGLVPAVEGPTLRASGPMRLAAMSATQTVQLSVRGLVVPDALVLLRTPVAQWQEQDDRATADVNPAVLGITSAAISRLLDLGRARDLDEAVRAASGLAERLRRCREEVDRLRDAVDPGEGAGDRLRARAQAQRLALDATAALVAAGGGRSMSLDDASQRLAREALFLLVQAQTVPARRASLLAWA